MDKSNSYLLSILKMSKVFKSERLIKSLTGLSISKFNELHLTFESVYKKEKARLYKGESRAQGGGRRSVLSTSKAKLFYIHFYIKCYPTYDLASFLFDVDRSQTCRWTRELLPILETTLERKLVLPKRKIRDIKEFNELFPAIQDIFIDGTERPTKNKRQAKHYSGKKKDILKRI